jgi:hypothetical protein
MKIKLLITFILIVLLRTNGFGQSPQIFNYTTSGATQNFTVPAGVTSLKIEAWGGGAGGDGTANKAGGGGAFAGYNATTVTAGTSYSVIVGGGGSAGNSGQDSSFGSLVLAKGGIVGTGGQATASTGGIKSSGGNGGPSGGNGGAGGGGAGGNPNSGSIGIGSSGNTGGSGGAGGTTGGGTGGAGGNNNSNGNAGAVPGGGGGERGNSGSNSGAGGNGRVIISWCISGYWTGATSTDWNTASNWCSNSVPTATTDVVIPSGTPNMPTIATGTTAVANNITINASATLTLANSATSLLNISGNFVNNGTFTANILSKTSFVGTNQNVAGVTYGNLTLAGSGTKTLTGVTIANGDLAINSGVTLATANYALTFQSNFTNSGVFTAGSSAIIIAGTATQNIASFTTTGIVSMTKTGGTATFQGNVNGAGLTINGSGGTLNLGSGLTHTFTGNWTRTNGTLNGGSSILKIAGDVSGTGGTLTAGTGTVEFNKAGAQNLGTGAITYNNLTLSGSGIKTFGAIATVSGNWSMVSGPLADLGGFIHTAGTLVLGGAGPLLSSWGSTASGAANTTNDYFTGTGKINVSSAPYPAIDNNYATYASGVSGQVAGSSGEYGNAAHTIPGSVTLEAPTGSAFINVKFASYGSPVGNSPDFTIGTCHAFNSRTVTTGFLGSNIATIPASGVYFNDVFGDPCNGVVKSYNVVATYAEPFCSNSPVPTFVIDGSGPTGGNGSYDFLWEVSTAGHSTGYGPASGINNAEDYTVPAGINQTTWYRRTVTSGIYSDATIVIIQVTAAPPVQPNTFTSVTNCDGTATLTVSTGSLGLGGYAEFYSGSCDGTVVGTATAIPATVIVSPTMGNTTYYVRYKNSCDKTAACKNTTVTNTISIAAAATATSVCFSTASQNASLGYTATTGTPDRYSVVWDTAAITAGLVNQTNVTFTFATGTGTLNTIAIPANVPAGTYTGTLTVKNNSTGCISFMNTFTVTVNALPTVSSTTSPSRTYTGVTNATTVSAIASAGATIDWYANASGGVALVSGSLTYTPTGISAGTYTVYAQARNTITGCISTSRTAAILTITKAALTITAAANSKIYDGTTASAAIPTITSGTLQGSDTASFTQTYDTKNVGTSKTMTATGVVTDGNSGNNYSYTFVTSTSGTITAKSLSVTGTTIASKVYNGSAVSGAVTVGTLAGFVGTETVTATATGLYADANFGTGKTAAVTYTLVNGANGGLASNYTLASGTATGDITKAALTITASAQNKCYGTVLTLGTTAFTASALQNGETITSVTLTSTGGYDASLTQPVNSYAGNIIPSTPTGGASFSASNYNITFVGGNLTIKALPTVSAGSQVCIGSTITLSPITGGTWTSSNANATVTNAGVVTGVATGSATFTFTNTTTGCSAVTSSVAINDKPTIASITAPAALCPGGSLNPAAPTVTANGSTVNPQGWEISTTSGGTSYVPFTPPYIVASTDNGKNIRYAATNGCGGPVYSNAVALSVSTPVITPTGTVGTAPYTFTIDNPNTYTTPNANGGQYALINVVKGFTYTFSVGNSFAGSSEVLTILDASNANVSPAATAAGSAGSTITNWVSSLSGQIKVVLTEGNCAANGAAGSSGITITLTGVNDTQDNQLATGLNSWIGHVYNIPLAAAPVTGASNAAMFAPSGLTGYAGYYTEAENFGLQQFGGGNQYNFPIYSNGNIYTNIDTQGFAVRYRMTSTKPAGCYLVTLKGDDGTRLYVDSNTVVTYQNNWGDHGTTTYANVLVNFATSSTNLVFDYYENGGLSEAYFKIIAFDNASNIITPTAASVCSGNTTTITGSYDYDENAGTLPNTNPSLAFSWESKTDSGAWVTIPGAIGLDYTPGALTTTTSNIVTQYRRTATAASPLTGTCTATISAPITITTKVLPVAAFSYTGTPYCSNAANPSPTFSGGGVAGVFSSTAGLVINTTTGQINLTSSTPGTYTVTNTIAAAGGCAVVTATSSVTIKALPVATFSYTGTPYCSNGTNPSPTFSGGGVAGAFTSTTGLVFISTSTGQIDLGGSTPGTYTVTNTIAAAGGCAVVTATSSVTIKALPVATFSYTGTPYCSNGTNPLPTFSGGGVAGVFSSTAGLVINTTTGQINLATSTPGTYTVTNTIAAAGGCAVVTATSSVTINALPTVSAGSQVCIGSTITLSPTTGGTWASSNANASVTNAGVVTGVTAGTATFTFTNTTTGCSATTSSVTINPLPNNITNGFVASKMCAGDSPQLTYDADDTTFTSPYSITYKNNATLVQYTITIPYASPFSFTPGDNPTANTGYTLLSISNATCTNSDVNSFLDSGANLVIRPMPTATISGTTSVCAGASSPNITFTNPQTVSVTVTYTINGGANQTINIGVGASNTSSVAVPTATGGSFVYSLKSVVYQDAPTCSNTVTGQSATVTVNTAPAIAALGQPTPSTVCVEGDASFTVTASGSGLTYQWQVSTNGGTNFSNLTNTGVYTNVTTATMNITAAATAMTNNQYRCVVSGTCTPAVTSSAAVLTVGADWGGISFNGGAYLTSNSTVYYCPSTMAEFSIAPISGVTQYSWSFPAGWVILSGDKTNTITVKTSPDLANSGPVYVAPFNNTFCPSYIKVQLSSAAPTAPSITKTLLSCAAPTGTVTTTLPAVTGAPMVSYTLIKTSVSPEVVIEKNDTGTFTGLAGGSYEVTYQLDSGCFSDRSNTAVIVPLVTNTWAKVGVNPAAWSAGRVPETDDYVVFDADYNLPVSVNSCSCVINSGANVTIGDANGTGLVLNIINGLDVQGTLTFENNSSLVQLKDDAANSGVITYKRTAPGLKDLDYVYWSSPVATQKLGVLYDSDRYFQLKDGAWDARGKSDLMEVGRGYIIRVRTAAPPFDQEVTFEGEPNNGVIKVKAQGLNKSNLIGNPYPSAIDADDFIGYNQPLSAGTLYFWTHFTARKLDVPSSEYRYSSDDYATYNISGGTSTVPSAAAPSTKGSGVTPSGKIASGQSFFVVSEAVGDFEFKNSMRFGDNGSFNDNSQFFKHSNTKKTAKIKKDRVWLNLTNDSGAFKQLLVGYITGATNDYDKLYDGVTRNGNEYIDFYSVNNSKNYAIQGRALPFDTADEVPLGYKTTIEGTFKIGIDNVDGGLANQTIYLEDKLTNTIHDLKSGSYAFTTAIGAFKDRFVLRYTNTSKLGTGDPVVKQKGFFVSVKNSQIKINSFDQIVHSVKVFDLKGSLLYERNKVDKNEFIIDTLTASSQFMIVMVQLEDGKWISEEIIFHD